MEKRNMRNFRKQTKRIAAGAMAALVAGTVFTAVPYNVLADEVIMEWREENGVKYWYENGVRQGVKYKDDGSIDETFRGKEIYDPSSDAWYWLDNVQQGAVAKSKDVYQDSLAGQWGDNTNENGEKTGKWVRYDENGHMVKGWNTNDNGTYYFDIVYGTMAKGDADIDGVHYYFNTDTGILESGGLKDDDGNDFSVDGWHKVGGVDYWYEGGVRQGVMYNEDGSIDTSYRGKEIYDPSSDAWYWLDCVQNGAVAKDKDVYQESEAGEWGDTAGTDGKTYGKWVRYDADGHMIKGWNEKDGNKYYFDPVYGTMVKGWVLIDGVSHCFDENTGVEKPADDPCNTYRDNSHNWFYHKYEHAYRTKDMSVLGEGDMDMYNAIKNYLDYAYTFNDDFSRVKAIHDYMCWTNEYDYTFSHYYIEDVLLDHTSVCNGYALTFAMFMDMLGIENDRIISYNLNHTWNAVKLEGDWYLVDVTWDDHCDYGGEPEYYYFMLPNMYFPEHEATDYESVNDVAELIPDSSTLAAYGMQKISNDIYYVTGSEEAQQKEIADILVDAYTKYKKYDIFTIFTDCELTSDYDSNYPHYVEYFPNIFVYSKYNLEDGKSKYFYRIVKTSDYEIEDADADNAVAVISKKLSESTASYNRENRYFFNINFSENLSEVQIKDRMEELIKELTWENIACKAYRYRYMVISGMVVLMASPDYDSYDKYLEQYDYIVNESEFQTKLDEVLSGITKENFEQGGFHITFAVTTEKQEGWSETDRKTLIENYYMSKWERIYSCYTDYVIGGKYITVRIYPNFDLDSYEEAMRKLEKNYSIDGYDNALNFINNFLDNRGLYTPTGNKDKYVFHINLGDDEKTYNELFDIYSKNQYGIYYDWYLRSVSDRVYILECSELERICEYKADDTMSDDAIVDAIVEWIGKSTENYVHDAFILEYKLTDGKTFNMGNNGYYIKSGFFYNSQIYNKLCEKYYFFSKCIDESDNWYRVVMYYFRKNK